MAKPINLYQGPAPAAMGMMGQGILEAGANAARSIQSGYESMGKGLASGITAAGNAYKEYKDDQAKFDATKKLFNAFESYLPKQKDPETGKEFSPMGDQIRSMFDDTSMSVREKNAMAPMLLSFLGNAQQQYGRESVANIMAGNRLDVAALKNPPPTPRPPFNATQTEDPYALPAGSSPANPQALQPPPQAGGASAAPYMIQRPPAQPQPVQQQSTNKMPLTKFNRQTGEMEFWSPGARRYVPEPVDFGTNPFQ